MIQKITSVNNIVWLIEKQTEELDAIVGNAITLTKIPNTTPKAKTYDPYIFNENIRIIHLKKIKHIVSATKNEIAFYELLREKKQVSFSKKLASKYELLSYVKETKKEIAQ